MKLYYAYGSGFGDKKNFGDELNAYLWKEILPDGFLDHDSSTLFVGIGTLITPQLPKAGRLIVAGSGCGKDRWDHQRPLWKILSVRGPLSARALGIESSLAITDPAILCRKVWPGGRAERFSPEQRASCETVSHCRFSFMPHMGEAQVNDGVWREICERAGVYYIDPFGSPLKVIQEIVASEHVYCQAMHGAIVANAYGVPWSALAPHGGVGSFKWTDWALSVGCHYDPLRIYRPAFNMSRVRWMRGCVMHLVYRQFQRMMKVGRQQSQVSNATILDELEERLLNSYDGLDRLKGLVNYPSELEQDSVERQSEK